MTAAQSTDFGQRVVQVRQETQSQAARLLAAFSISPRCTSRMSRFGSKSMRSAMGQPAEHLPH
jgi:hypothetical protein